jgi:hypothetical protein
MSKNVKNAQMLLTDIYQIVYVLMDTMIPVLMSVNLVPSNVLDVKSKAISV